jgi:hypothetical protein
LNPAEFVEETLSEILTGIRAAQQKDGGKAIGAAGVQAWTPTYHLSSLLAPGVGDDVFTVVEFDVSVLAETSGGGEGSIESLVGRQHRGGRQTLRPAHKQGSVCGPGKNPGGEKLERQNL